MNEQPDRSLHDRIERLENIVQDLQHMIKKINEVEEARPSPQVASVDLVRASSLRPAPKTSLEPFPSQMSAKHAEITWKSESLLNKIGIGLLLFGVAFVFKYSIDQGWITPAIRVSFGLILGIGMLVIGLRINNRRRHFSQILLGGGIATFYISGFAAFQLFGLVAFSVAMSFMGLVTLLSLFLSLRQNEVVLSLIGALGGLATPFLLYTGVGNLSGLVGYTCLLLSGTSAIYFYRGWRSLLWVSVIGGWIVFLVGLSKGLPSIPQEAIWDRWALQFGLIFGWLAFGALPVIREVVWANNPTKWSRPSFDFGDELISQDTRDFLDMHVHLLAASTPLITLAMSMASWSLSHEAWGWITMGGSIIYGLASWNLKRVNVGKNLAYTHILMGVLLFTIALCLLLSGDVLFFSLAVEATVLRLIDRGLRDKSVIIASHILFGMVGMWLGFRLFKMPVEGTAIFNIQALTDFSVVIAGLGVSKLLKSTFERSLYQLSCHVAILGWFARELSTLSSGQGYVTIAWGIYAVVLLILGLRLNLNDLRTVAMGTLLLVVGKLFLVDLVKLEAIWRILLFIGFGGLFLVISYYFQALKKREPQSAGESSDNR